MKRVLITGIAGFIGYHLAARLSGSGFEITGLDDLIDYYDPRLKIDRLTQLGINLSRDTQTGSSPEGSIRFFRSDLADSDDLRSVFETATPEVVVHLAAQAGVRYSIDHPEVYGKSNLTGFLNILECCRRAGVKHLVFASSSSVYGSNTRMPFSVSDPVNHPVSLYAATKKANELMAHTYSHLYRLPTTGLRFFTVYGPWGRPDMAPIKFARAIFAGDPIDIYNHGDMKRDFTYVGDIVESISRLIDRPPAPDPAWTPEAPDAATSNAPYRLHNIGRGEPVALLDFVREIERAAGRSARLNLMPMQPGDVKETWADTQSLVDVTGYRPKVSLSEGIDTFIDWYRQYYQPV